MTSALATQRRGAALHHGVPIVRGWPDARAASQLGVGQYPQVAVVLRLGQRDKSMGDTRTAGGEHGHPAPARAASVIYSLKYPRPSPTSVWLSASHYSWSQQLPG